MFGWFALFFFFFGIGAVIGLLYVLIRAVPLVFLGLKSLLLLPRDLKRAFAQGRQEYRLLHPPSAARRETPRSPSPSVRGGSSR